MGSSMETSAERSKTIAAEGNFSATRVRHYLTAGGAKVAHPACRGAPSVEALPVALLGHSTGDGSLQIAARRRAVDLPVITRRAEVHDAAARIANALNLPKIVHPRRTRPPGIRPPWACRATTSSSYASTRGDRGLGAHDSGPFSLWRSCQSSRTDRSGGQLPGQGGLHRIRRILAPGYRLASEAGAAPEGPACHARAPRTWGVCSRAQRR